MCICCAITTCPSLHFCDAYIISSNLMIVGFLQVHRAVLRILSVIVIIQPDECCVESDIFNIVLGDAENPCDEACSANFDSSRRLCWGPGPKLCQKSKYNFSLIVKLVAYYIRAFGASK